MTSFSCREVTGLVTEAMEGALAWEALARFHDHLERCEACRTFVRQVSRTLEVLRMLPQEAAQEPDEQLVAAFRRRR